MSILSNPRVAPCDDGYEVTTKHNGTLKVLPLGGGWAAYFASSTAADPRPVFGIPGSQSAVVEDAIEWALR